MPYFRMGVHTIIGAGRFHFRGRDGIGWFPPAMAARQFVGAAPRGAGPGAGGFGPPARVCPGGARAPCGARRKPLFTCGSAPVEGARCARRQAAWALYGQASRAISTRQLQPLPAFHTAPINLVVFQGPSGGSRPQGGLILGGASRLDAFSGYPVRT